MRMSIRPFFDRATSTFSYVVDDGAGRCAVIDPVMGFDQKAGKSSEGYVRIVQFDPGEQRPIVQDFVKAFKAKYGEAEVPTHINAHAYDQILIVAEAVKRGAKDPKSFRDTLAKMKGIEVTTGTIDFDEKGQNSNLSVIHYVQTNPDLTWKTLDWNK